MEYIRSRFTFFGFLRTIVAAFFALFGVFFLIYFVRINILEEEFTSTVLQVVVIFGGLLAFLLCRVLRDKKYLIIGKDSLTFYSFLRPFGKTIYFENYIGKAIVYPDTLSKVLVFIDKKNRTAFRVEITEFRQVEKIFDAIPLKYIEVNPTWIQENILMFGGSITIKEQSTA